MRRKLVRIGFVAANVALLAIVVYFVIGARTNDGTQPLAAKVASANSSAAQTTTNPLDQVSSVDIAETVARMTALPETTPIVNQAESEAALLATAPTTNDVIFKPEVVATAFKSNKDIQTYVVQPGDTVSSIAAKFSVTSNSIKWSNNLRSDTVSAGTKLLIPPVGYSGIVYTVKAGDTLQKLATKYRASLSELTAANDAEIGGIHVGEQIIIPNGQEPVSTYSYGYSSGYAWGLTAIYGYNGYDYGYCTWYVASQIAVPSNWGNASSWAYYAEHTPGWKVSSRPSVGAIAQTPYAAGGEGHVAIVTAVSADGTQIKYKDMNGIAGWGRIGYSGWTSASLYPSYITRS